MQEQPNMAPTNTVPEKEKWKGVPKTKPTAFYLSIIMLLIAVAVSLYFWGMDFFHKGNISAKQEELQAVEQKIAGAQTNHKIMIANILQNNSIRPSIKLDDLVRDFRSAGREAGVQLQGFSIANDILSTELISVQESRSTDPVVTIINMMRAYEAASNSDDERAFRLEPILHVGGTPESRNSQIQFSITPTTSQ